MDYEVERNNIIRKYINQPIHLNHIIHDSKAKFKHRKKVNEICNLLIENNLEFLCRPEITLAKGQEWKFGKNYPDILYFIKFPFQIVVLEVLDNEKKEHAESKSYPSEFKVIPFNVKDSVEILEELL